MNDARQNASRLLKDAEVLLEAERYPSALAMAILSIEESGKTIVLRDLSTAVDANDVKRVWKEYRSHTKKNILWVFPDLIARGVRTDSLYSTLFDPASDHPAVLDALKQVAIYTDCLGNRHWSKPLEVVSRELAASIVKVAKLFVRHEQYSVEQLELWVQYIGPARKQGSALAIKNAFLAWDQEVMRRGWEQDSKERQFLRQALMEIGANGTSPGRVF